MQPLVLAAAVVATTLIALRPLVADSLTPTMGHCAEDEARMMPPSEVHLKVAIEEHQSWVVFPARFGPDALFILCVDQEQWPNLPHTVHDGVARYDISTRWVLAQALAGRLPHYQDPSTWRLFEIYCPPNAPITDVGDGQGALSCD